MTNPSKADWQRRQFYRLLIGANAMFLGGGAIGLAGLWAQTSTGWAVAGVGVVASVVGWGLWISAWFNIREKIDRLDVARAHAVARWAGLYPLDIKTEPGPKSLTRLGAERSQ